jgi:hypothetical protein
MTAPRGIGHPKAKLLALFAVFAVPMLVAWVMVTWRIGIPEQRSAHGELAPDLPVLSDWPLQGRSGLAEEGDWVLAFDCTANCEVHSDQWWRLHRALGREAPRVSRMRIGGDSEPLPGESVTHWVSPPDWTRPGRLWVLDPRGQPVLGYDVGVEPGDVLDDLNRLLRLNPQGTMTQDTMTQGTGTGDREVAEW